MGEATSPNSSLDFRKFASPILNGFCPDPEFYTILIPLILRTFLDIRQSRFYRKQGCKNHINVKVASLSPPFSMPAITLPCYPTGGYPKKSL